MKNRHHFVPRFYLRRFASQPRRIHVFNLRRQAAYESVGLRDQCFRRRFYGDTPEVEDAFASLESIVAPTLKAIGLKRVAPATGTAEYIQVVAFVALQLLRTTAAVKRVRRTSEKLASAAFNGSPPSEFQLDEDQALVISLSNLTIMVRALDDLASHVIAAPSGTTFITSDNPVFRYNQYCESIRGVGVLGGVCRGLQVFLPLSPELCVLLYDSVVYKTGRRGTAPSSRATMEDVRILNLMQLVAADQNVYFSNWAERHAVESLALVAMRHRSQSGARLTEAVENGNERSVLLHQYEQMPDLNLALSFAKVRRNARRVPLFERAQKVRKAMPDTSEQMPQEEASQLRHFRVTRRW